MSGPDPVRDCRHGRLKRKCEECDMENELARLREIERAARSLMSREDFWRAAAMLVTLPGEIDNLADALASGGDEARCEACAGTGTDYYDLPSTKWRDCPACKGTGRSC